MKHICIRLSGLLLAVLLLLAAGCDTEAALPTASPAAPPPVETIGPTAPPAAIPSETHVLTPAPSAEPVSTPSPTPVPTPPPTPTPEPTPDVPPAGSTFEIHFLDVGQADGALVLCDGKAMLIDGGNTADSSLIYAYLKSHGVTRLDYIVATHAHEDHVGGLSGALNYASVGVALCSVEDHDSEAFRSFVKYLDKQGVSITVPAAGDVFSLGSAQVQILGPVRPSADPNNMSIVLRIVYGETSFLFTGDAEREEEQDILAAGYPLESTVLKVGHHGSESSTTYPFLREIMPTYAVISVGRGNSYGHPTDNTLSRLRDADVTVYRTDELGHIICTSDGKTVAFTSGQSAPAPEKTPSPTAEPTPEPTAEPTEAPSGQWRYILNTNTKKFHYPSCSSADKIKEKNKGHSNETRDELIARGYSPCGNCRP